MNPNARVVVIERDGKKMVAGAVVRFEQGWKFFPHYQATPSRKFHDTAESAVSSRLSKFSLE